MNALADQDVDKFGKCLGKVLVQQKKSKAWKILCFDRWAVGFQNFDYFQFMMIPLLPKNNRKNYQTLNGRKSYDYIKKIVFFFRENVALDWCYLQKA